MANQVTGKHKKNSTGEWIKHPRKFLKRLGNKRLRSSESPKSLNALLTETPRQISQGSKN